MWIIIALLLSATIIYLLIPHIRKFNKRAEENHQQFVDNITNIENEIKQLSIDKARERLLPLLDNPDNFCINIENVVLENELGGLAPGVRDFLEQYQYIETMWGHYEIGGDNVEIWDIDDLFIKIGTGLEFSDLVVKCGDEAIYEIYSNNKENFNPNIITPNYPSLYHLLLVNCREIRKDEVVEVDDNITEKSMTEIKKSKSVASQKMKNTIEVDKVDLNKNPVTINFNLSFRQRFLYSLNNSYSTLFVLIYIPLVIWGYKFELIRIGWNFSKSIDYILPFSMILYFVIHFGKVGVWIKSFYNYVFLDKYRNVIIIENKYIRVGINNSDRKMAKSKMIVRDRWYLRVYKGFFGSYIIKSQLGETIVILPKNSISFEKLKNYIEG